MFSQFLSDTVKIIKKDGTVIPKEIKAMVQSKSIHIHDIEIDIAEGDFIERLLPNGNTDKFVILDTGYHTGFGGIPARYECKVEKINALKTESKAQTVYHINGNHSRVYNNSSDNSTNIINVNSDTLFSELKEFIKSNIEDNKNLIKIVTEMEINKNSTSYLKKYTDFIAAAANHITILSPFIPALTELLK